VPTYFLDIEAIPTSAAVNAADVAGASVLTFVIADTKAEAESMARAAIIGHAWVVKDISLFLQPTDEQISRLDRDIKAIHQQALNNKIGLLFVAHSKLEGQPDDPFQIRSLGFPVIDESSKH
jgi:hypothetical protein